MIIYIFERWHCGHPNFPYAYIQLNKSTKLIFKFSGRWPSIHSRYTEQRYNWFFFTDLRKLHPEQKKKMIKTIMHLRQHMEMDTLLFNIIWYQLLGFSTQIHFKLCWSITPLQKLVALTIIRILHHIPKKRGELYYYLYFTGCKMYHFQYFFVLATLIAEAYLKSL